MKYRSPPASETNTSSASPPSTNRLTTAPIPAMTRTTAAATRIPRRTCDVRSASSTVPICANRTALADHVPDVETARAYVPRISRMRSP